MHRANRALWHSGFNAGRRYAVACLLLLCCTLAQGRAAEQIPLYTYYDEPPFAIGHGDNLTTRLADWLSRRSKGRFEFVPTYLPRIRLDLTISSDPHWRAAVAWASPSFFQDEARRAFAWSIPYMQDVNLIVSHRSKPVHYSGPASLYGLRVGAVLGRKLSEFDVDIARGKIHREDAPTTLSNLQKLQFKRIDATFISASALPSYRQQIPTLDQWLFIAETPRSNIERHIMLSLAQQDLLLFFNQALGDMPHDPYWQAVQKSMGAVHMGH
jgi:polar amino acid transport system substrate-binding protein